MSCLGLISQNVMKCFTKGFYFPPCEKNMSDFIFLFDSEVLNISSSRVANKIDKKKTKRLLFQPCSKGFNFNNYWKALKLQTKNQ